MPDNSFVITSNSEDFYSILYYISSFLAQISYYVGPWIVAPFLTYAFVYNFILITRDRRGDGFVGMCLTLFFFGLTFLIFPGGMGDGLKIILERHSDVYTIFFSTLLFGLLVFYLTLRGAFFKILKLLVIKLDTIGKRLLKIIQHGYNYQKKSYIAYKETSKDNNLKENVAKLFTESKKKITGFKKSTSSIEADFNQNNDFEDRITPIVKRDLEVADMAQTSEVPILETTTIAESLAEKDDLKVDNKVKAPPVKNRANTSGSTFFNTADLISCISENINHVESTGPDKEYFSTIIQAIESKLAEFKLDANVINILKGPVVDTFELELGSGVKVSKVTGLSDDIGLALNGAPIRIVYPMRGKSTIGIEVPRNPRDYIYLDDVLNSDAFNDSTLRLPVAMGKDAFGDVKVVDLAGMPHMLVAGATGAGKSVFINTLLVSLIIKKSPRQLKLILIDPKQLELALFQDLPHLMLPVITDPKSSAIALLWAVQEMDKRYTILKELGVKNIEGFNKKIKTCDQSMLWKINEHYEDTQDEGYELPYIVIVIDEFADLILSSMGKEIELNVNRLAAKARAAGIHLVVATQRPSTDVVTGVVKANFPTRVAFRVSTGHDSKTILDQYGAQKLLGKGDMLYKHGVDLIRMHSSFVDETEIEGLLEKLATIPASFNTGAIDFLENGGEEIEEPLDAEKRNFTSGTVDDPVYQQALEIVFEQGSASASMLQRRLRVGYNRAANLVEEMERNGVIGPAQGSKPRKLIARPD